MENLFYSKDGGNFFGIAFDKIFQQPLIADYNEFEMSAKRNFKNLVPKVVETYEELFLDKKGNVKEEWAVILFSILNGKSQTMLKAPMTVSDFQVILDTICDAGDRAIIRMIDSFVEKNYGLTLDEETEASRGKNKKINKELQFNDEHARVLLKISYLFRLLIPLVSVYLTFNKDIFAKPQSEPASEVEPTDSEEGTESELSEEGNEEEAAEKEDMAFETVNEAIFSHLFAKFTDNPDAIKNKLFKLVYSRIARTAYSDKRFWTIAKNVAITKETEALEIYKKLITNVLPKLSIDPDMSVVSFFQAVINNQIDFLFQNKFKYRLNPIYNRNSKQYSEDNEDEITEFERMEMKFSRSDEGAKVLSELHIEETLSILDDVFDVGISEEEIRLLQEKNNRNANQEDIVIMMISKIFSDPDATKKMTNFQYYHAVLACKKFLEKHKFTYLPKILGGYCQKHRERANIVGKRVRPMIYASKSYSEMIKDKFAFFNNHIEKPFIRLVATIYSSDFTDEDGNDLFDSTVKVGKIAEELVDVAKMV